MILELQVINTRYYVNSYLNSSINVISRLNFEQLQLTLSFLVEVTILALSLVRFYLPLKLKLRLFKKKLDFELTFILNEKVSHYILCSLPLSRTCKYSLHN